MYEKPAMRRFGTLRELTLIGFILDGLGGFFGGHHRHHRHDTYRS